MRRGTTPTHTFTLPVDAVEVDKLSIAYAQRGGIVVEKGLDDIERDGKKITVTLSETDTLAFKADVDVEIQIRFGRGDERFASEIITESADRILKDGVLV